MESFTMALSTSLAGCLVSFYYYYVFTEIIVFNTNSLDPESALFYNYPFAGLSDRKGNWNSQLILKGQFTHSMTLGYAIH